MSGPGPLAQGKKQALRPKDVVLLGLLGALMFAGQTVMSFLPNIEPVSLLVMVYAVTLGRRALYPIYVFVGLDIGIHGINLWTIQYLYVWLVLYLFARLLRRMESPLGWALLSGAFGLCFGLLCAIVHLPSGWAFALSWWISGIPWDIAHCAGNFVIALLLFKPLRELLTKLLEKF